MRKAMTAALWPALVLALALSAGPALAASSHGYRLEVGRRVYDLTPNQPTVIHTPDGKPVEVTLRVDTALRFDDYGVAFSYPRGYKLEQNLDDDGTATVSVESSGSILIALSLLPPRVEPAELLSHSRQIVEKEYPSEGMRFAGEWQRVNTNLAGGRWPGLSREMELNGQRFVVTLFALRTPRRTIGVLVQFALEQEQEAKDAWRLFADTLR